MKAPTDYDGYAELAYAIARARRQEYRKALKNFLKNPDVANKGRVAHWEQKLKGPVTNLSDKDVATLRKQLTQELLPVVAREKIRVAKVGSVTLSS